MLEIQLIEKVACILKFYLKNIYALLALKNKISLELEFQSEADQCFFLSATQRLQVYGVFSTRDTYGNTRCTNQPSRRWLFMCLLSD